MPVVMSSSVSKALSFFYAGLDRSRASNSPVRATPSPHCNPEAFCLCVRKLTCREKKQEPHSELDGGALDRTVVRCASEACQHARRNVAVAVCFLCACATDLCPSFACQQMWHGCDLHEFWQSGEWDRPQEVPVLCKSISDSVLCKSISDSVCLIAKPVETFGRAKLLQQTVEGGEGNPSAGLLGDAQKSGNVQRTTSAAAAYGDVDSDEGMSSQAQMALGVVGSRQEFVALRSARRTAKPARRNSLRAFRAAHHVKKVKVGSSAKGDAASLHKFRVIEEDEFKTRTYVCSCPMCRKPTFRSGSMSTTASESPGVERR